MYVFFYFPSFYIGYRFMVKAYVLLKIIIIEKLNMYNTYNTLVNYNK